MTSLLSEHGRQGVVHGAKANVQNLHAPVSHEQSDLPITIKPFSLWVLIFCGLIFFFTGFFTARYGVDFTSASTSPATPQSAPTPQMKADVNVKSTAGSSLPVEGVPVVVHVVVRNM